MELSNFNKGIPKLSNLPPSIGSGLLGLNGLSDLWGQTLGDPGITIAVLDGPCDLTHPSLVQASITQLDFAGTGPIEGPAGDHGTHTASIIFGQHNSPVKGVAPLCRGLVIPIFRNTRQGGISSCSQPDLARAIRAASTLGADVINVSAGQFSLSGVAHPMLAEAIQECHQQGRLIVAAAGNDGCPCLHVPGALPAVLTVGAMDESGNPMEFSNWGSQYQTSGILAPGLNILGALPGNRTGARTGTSFAAPIVSGLAGLLLSLQKKNNGAPDSHAVRAAMLESALGCDHQEIDDCRRLLAGRLNVNGSVTRILGGEKMPTSSDMPVQSAVYESTAQSAPMTGNESADRNVLSPEPNSRVQVSAKARRGPERRRAASEGVKPLEQFPVDDDQTDYSENEIDDEDMISPVSIKPSDCACKGNGELVYAIGRLCVDFGTQARMDSLQQNVNTFNSGPHLNVRLNSHLLRHLLGWKDIYKVGNMEESKYEYHKPHLYDAKDIFWVLMQDESPQYAIKPSGTYSEEAYFELAHFLMEQEGYSEEHMPIVDKDAETGPNNVFYHPSLNTYNSEDVKLVKNKDKDREIKGRNISKPGRPVPYIDHVAIPGTLGGTVRLMNGMVVPVICPNMRGTRSWKLKELVKMHAAHDPSDESEKAKENEAMMLYMERISQRFYEESRNSGRSGAERAINFAATQSFENAAELKRKFKLEFNPDLDNIQVKRSPTCREDSECYDVDIEFFDPDNMLRSKFVLRHTVDVGDEVPVKLGEPRGIRKR